MVWLRDLRKDKIKIITYYQKAEIMVGDPFQLAWFAFFCWPLSLSTSIMVSHFPPLFLLYFLQCGVGGAVE